MNPKNSVFREHDLLIKRSWQRCRKNGLNHHSQPIIEQLAVSDLSVLLDEHEHLLRTTHYEVIPYYENLLGNSNSQVMLADSRGYLMNSWGEQRFKVKHKEIFTTGSSWSEKNIGTNAIGTVLYHRNIMQINHDEHFLIANRFMTGAAAPIWGINKEILGVIDISTNAYLPQSHTLGMANIMSQAIENQLIISHYNGKYFLLRFNTSVDNIDSQWSALIVFDENGLIISSNRRAEILLARQLKHVNIVSLFNITLEQLLNQPGLQIPLQTPQKFNVYGIVHRPPPIKSAKSKLKTSVQTDYRPNSTKPQDYTFKLDELDHGDHVMLKTIQQSRRIIDKDIPILICGETGTGKEVFVKALHQSCQRHKQKLITVNCAAIPQELVESELFGYEKGAFTGANTKGYIGLIRKADKGTLFLDEIGDMPINVQARLLRVLQERKVTPLGSTESYDVDFRLISATNCHLKEAVRDGSFRQDLYYRVSGLNIQLPALRHRSDRQELVQFLLNFYAENEQHAFITERVMDAFCNHPWPGNIRQLVSVIKIAQAMSDNETIDMHHLPEDFFHDIEQLRGNVAPFLTPKKQAKNNEEKIHNKSDSNDIVSLYQSLSCNISKTAKELGVSRNTVYKRLRQCGYK